MARNKITYLEAAKLILELTKRSLRSQEIVDEIQKRQLRDISGKTPSFTINARISEDIAKLGNQSAFKRVGKGKYALRENPEGEYSAKPFQKRIYRNDLILVFPPSKLDKIGHFHGIQRDYQKYRALFNPENSFFYERIAAEKTENYKQIVSYVILKHNDHVLRYVRGKVSRVGKELGNNYSIGFGGHVQDTDNDLFSVDMGYSNSVRRELLEEVGIDLTLDCNSSIYGVLNDDSSPLGRSHFAVVHLVEIDNPNFIKGEKSVNELGFIKINDLGKEFAKYEYWSKLCILDLFGKDTSLDCVIETCSSLNLKQKGEIIIIVGFIGSGKTEACTLLANEFNYKVITVSKVLKDLLGYDANINTSRRNLQEDGLDFVIQPDGHERLANAIANIVSSFPKDRFVIDGLRFPETLKKLKEILRKPMTIVYIDTMIDRLYSYYKEREHNGISLSRFLDVIHHPVEREIEFFVPFADVIVYNHGSLSSYLTQMKAFFTKEIR